MKYIKRFNESINEEEFEAQCEVYISELADLEIDVEIKVFSNEIIDLYINRDGELFDWEYVKEVMIPFLEFLYNKYTIRDISINDEYLEDSEDESKSAIDRIVSELMGYDEREITFDHIISDDFNSSEISWIKIKLK